MSGFSIDWLDLREDADRRARDTALRERVVDWLAADPTSSADGPVVVDLGAGTGSSLRALDATRPVSWRLVDHDQTLLSEAKRRHGSTQRIDTFIMDLSEIDRLPFEGARLVTASALFDLVSAEFIETLTRTLKTQCEQQPLGIYAALNYDGTTHWTPTHPLDEPVLQAFNQDQRKDKGFGPALGPEAGNCMGKRFSDAGFKVDFANSPWVLNGADQPLVSALITGIAGAVADTSGLDKYAVAEWVEFRQAMAASGTCTVGHIDVLALPE